MSVKAWVHQSDELLGGRGVERRIFLNTPFRLKDVCKGLPGARWDKVRKAWHVPATTASASALVKAFRFEQLKADAAVAALIEGAKMQRQAQRLKVATDLPDIPVRTDAWLHQKRAFAFANELEAAMLAMDMGTGKSLVAIALEQEWDARKVLIICPVSVVGVWPKQFQSHALDPDEWAVVAPTGKMPIAGRVTAIAKGITNAERTGRRYVVVTNYEAAWRGGMEVLLRSIEWDAVILDESHRVKSAGGKQSMFTTSLRKHSKRRLALTGTPMPHSPLDVYAQYRFLDPGIFGTSKNRFQNRYAIMGGYEGRQVTGWQEMDEFNEKFSSIAFVVSSEDALPDLPERIPLERTFTLGPEALRAYKLLAEEFVAEVDEGLIVAQNALTRTLRFRQITSGHTKLDDGTIIHLDDGRERLLADVLDEVPSSEPVVVFASFHPDLDAIRRVTEAKGLRYGELSGRRRDGLTGESTMAEDIDVLGCQIKSGGVGIDLTRSSYAIYYNVGYELGDYDQSQKRLHRPGQTRHVRYIHLIAENAPIDRIVYKALRERRSVIDSVLEAAKEREL